MPSTLVPDEIRILDFPPAPGEEDIESPIECTTRAIKLNGNDEYEALSYVWGTDQETAIVRISGQDVRISKTLEKALRRLQLPHRARALWIDQLCIDQNNATEKMQQVRHMGAIYEGCTQCVAWMGEVRDDIALADADASPFPRPWWERSPRPTGRSRASAASRTPDAVLPDDLTFQWGPLTLPWDVLHDTTQTFFSAEPRTYFAFDHDPDGVWDNLIAHVAWIHNAHIRDDSEFRMSTPSQLIHRWRSREATNPLDKIYGVLGLFDSGSLPLTERCDYELMPARVYATMTQELILNEKGLRPLTVNPRVEEARATPGIPSWALALAAPDGPAARPATFALIYGYWSYQADRRLGPINLDIIEAQLGQDKLTVTGVLIDTVAAVEQRQENREDRPLPIEKTLQRSYQFAVLEQQQQQDVAVAFSEMSIGNESPEKRLYPGGLYDRTEAFARLALGDVIRDRQHVPARTADGEDVQKVLDFLQRDVEKEHEEEPELHGPTRNTIRDVLLNQRVFITARDLLGCGHLDTQAGD
ncbi:HET-domain-containing protein [Apiospora hydei]|uniref:HET-domain-containing protein n=1 Tax=Apiospora hydei TaxID=1337664 RepID=A0ABR1X8J2_9PEZI